VVGVFEVLVAVVGTHVAGEEFFLPVNTQVVGINLEGQMRPGTGGGHRVGVGVQVTRN
jgi:hypothetical protein